MTGLTISTPQLRLLQRLCEANAVSGDEGEVRRIVLAEAGRLVDDLHVDALGNVLATKRGAGRNRLKVMLAAHMDEVGFMIVSEDGDGFYQFGTVGKPDVSQLAGKVVSIGREKIPAVIGMKPVHLSDGGGWEKVSVDSLRMDTGGRGGVHVGDRASFNTRFRRQGRTIFARALDDRLGVVTLLELLKHAPPNIDLQLAFTVQEEVDLRGAKVAAHALAPDIGIAVDSTAALDLPAHDGRENTVYNSRLGRGPAIYLADKSTLHDRRLVDHFSAAAQAEGIPFQYRQPGGEDNDAGGIQGQLEGIPVLSISVPGRYPHSPVGVCRVDDWQNTLRLLYAGLSRIQRSILKR